MACELHNKPAKILKHELDPYFPPFKKTQIYQRSKYER